MTKRIGLAAIVSACAVTFLLAVAVSDDFNRGDSSTLGANWSEDTGDWEIVGNTLQFVENATNDGYKVRWVGTALSSNDYYVEADVDTTNSTACSGVGVRMTAGTGDANSDGYAYLFCSADFSYIVRFDNSALTTLVTCGAVAAGAAFLNTRLRVAGTTLTGTRDGAADCNITDATYATGAPGAWMDDFGTADAEVFDNWSADDEVAGGGATPTITLLGAGR